MQDEGNAASPELWPLHTLRCIGVADARRMAEAAGLSDSEAESALIDLGAAGLVRYLPGEFGGWQLTDEGRLAGAALVAEELEQAEATARVREAYDAFVPLNAELLDVCTAWQIKGSGPAGVLMNDHRDAAYDNGVLDRLANLHASAESVLATLAGVLPRFDRYRLRLREALAKATAGAGEYVTESTASYHTIWFQLHEDLLVTLGLPRH